MKTHSKVKFIKKDVNFSCDILQKQLDSGAGKSVKRLILSSHLDLYSPISHIQFYPGNVLMTLRREFSLLGISPFKNIFLSSKKLSEGIVKVFSYLLWVISHQVLSSLLMLSLYPQDLFLHLRKDCSSSRSR